MTNCAAASARFRICAERTRSLREIAEPLIHHAAARDRFAFIHARRDRFGAERLCRVLLTDSGNYFAWVRARAGAAAGSVTDSGSLN